MKHNTITAIVGRFIRTMGNMQTCIANYRERIMKFIVLTTVVLMIGTSMTFALPEYMVEYNQTCALCHHNPTGGGMRTLYGSQFFSYSDLPMKPKSFEEIQSILPKAGDALQYGFDLRSLYVFGHGYDDDENMQTQGNEYVLMQGDVYFAYALNDATSAVIDVSLNGIEEAFANFSAWNGKLRLRSGKFKTSYGWGWVDHTTYVRRFLDYGSLQGPGSRTYDSGFEGGFYNDRWDATLGVVNGLRGTNGNAYYTRLARRFGNNTFSATLGLSGRSDDLGGGGFSPMHYGAFYGADIGPFTWLGETNLAEEIEGTNAFITTQQLRYMIKRGLFLHGWYEFYDPDLDKQSGFAYRYRLGLDIIPRGYIGITPIYEWNHEELDGTGSNEFGQLLLQLHLWL